MQLPTQEQFVKDCWNKYWFTDIPADQQWEAAHFPLPACSGEGDTVQLWSADHTVQGLLQSVEFDHKCFHYAANSKDLLNLQIYYPQYLELFKQLKSKFNSRNGKKCAELKVGVCGRSAAQMTANGKKGGKKCAELKVGIHAPGMQSAAGKKAVELKVGIHGQSAEQMSANGKVGGKKTAELKLGVHAAGMQSAAGKKAAELGVGCHAPGVASAAGKKGGKKTSAQKWQCLVTGHISSPGPLSLYQKKRGIDTSSRIKLISQTSDL